MADKRRRKSLRLFRPRPETPTVPIAAIDLEGSQEKSIPGDLSEALPVDTGSASPKLRPRTLQKSSRSSIFGSWRSLQSLDEDERATLTHSGSPTSSFHDEKLASAKSLYGEKVERYGEVQAPGSSMFKKRTNFIVLTESHLVRFKNQSKAIEMFPTIPASTGRPAGSRSSMSSIGSYSEMQMGTYVDNTQGFALVEIIAIYMIDDGRPFSTVELSCLDERSGKGSMMQLSFNELREAESWIASIRTGSEELKKGVENQILPQTLENVARTLQREADYDPLHYRVFKVVRRAAARATGRLPSEDLAKNQSVVCYFAIGINKVHLIPVQRTSMKSSSTSLDAEIPSSYGITNLTSVQLRTGEDLFHLVFRKPTKHANIILFSSFDASQIVLWLRYASEFVRPEWTVQPFIFDVPPKIDDQLDPPTFPTEENNCFDRTLIAYCSALDVDTARICYSVDYDCEDAPCFCLLPPLDGIAYLAMELLAVFRSLRYNEAFSSISFANVDLRPLRDLYDPIGVDNDSLCTRSGTVVNLSGHAKLSVLSQEVRALALKSRRLRRFDFSYALSAPRHENSERRNCGIPEALTPLCKKSLTNVDWIILSGIKLSETDMDYLVDAASERQCHLRALEIGDCGLDVHDIDVLLSTLGIHDNTMEVVDISGAQGRFSPELFQRSIGAFSHIRKLNLTRVQKTAGSEPLIAPEILLSWRLESLLLSQMPLNEQSVEAIAAYLTSTKSDTLRQFHVNQCGLTGKDLALFFRSMARTAGIGRNMHVSASENRLGTGSSELSRSIAENFSPTSLTIRMMDFVKEVHFRELVIALSVNTTLKRLDISQASLPYDASPETCEALKEMLSQNKTLEELDISGDLAHLDAARFGIGLNTALLGLRDNKTLKLLRIEHQSLGLQGAHTLAGVIEANQMLVEIHCDHNDLNLQSFTVLVDALAGNRTLLFLSTPKHDRARSMEKVKEEFVAMEKADETSSPNIGPIKKSITVFAHKGSRHHRHSSSVSGQSIVSFTEKDAAAAMAALEEKWHTQIARMQRYLLRNYHLASGLLWTRELEEERDQDDSLANPTSPRDRPNSGDSLSNLLARVKMDRTPTMERKASPLDMTGDRRSELRAPVFQLPKD